MTTTTPVTPVTPPTATVAPAAPAAPATPTASISKASRAKHLFRIASLVVPTWLAWYVTFSAKKPDELIHVVSLALGPVWVLFAAALVMRVNVIMFAPGIRERRKTSSRPKSYLTQIDLLTSSGATLAWLSAFAIMGAVWIGYASIAVVGLLGTALFHIVVLYAFVALRTGHPLNGNASVKRRFSPEVMTEGDDVLEELRFTDTRIPLGYRLFVTGRIGPRWSTCRHVLEATESGAEVELESEVGPAVRGEHEPELLSVWLEDTFGLTRSMCAHVGKAKLTVLPKLRKVEEKTAPLLDHGLGEHTPRNTNRLPTEGLFHLREYQQGDDVRRIHWVRSVAAGELIVRLPDEIPPDQPRVRLVLDTFFPEAFALTSCDAPSEMLDVIVATWLAVARALVESGVRVTLVTSLPRGDGFATARHDLVPRDRKLDATALRIGAQVAWQNRVMVSELLTEEDATFIVSRGVLMVPPTSGKVRFILVPPVAPERQWPLASANAARLPFPMGSSENRYTHRRRVTADVARARADHARAMLAIRTNLALPPPGSFAAIASSDGVIRLEALQS